MSGAVLTAKGKLTTAMFAFEESLGTLPHLTAQQRRAVTLAAGALAKECMRIQTEMDVALIGEVFER